MLRWPALGARPFLAPSRTCTDVSRVASATARMPSAELPCFTGNLSSRSAAFPPRAVQEAVFLAGGRGWRGSLRAVITDVETHINDPDQNSQENLPF
jgi:hypothetical protein